MSNWIAVVIDDGELDEDDNLLTDSSIAVVIGPFPAYADAERHPTRLGEDQSRYLMVMRDPDDPTYRTATMQAAATETEGQ